MDKKHSNDDLVCWCHESSWDIREGRENMVCEEDSKNTCCLGRGEPTQQKVTHPIT